MLSRCVCEEHELGVVPWDQVIDIVELILPVVFFSEIGDGANAVCGGGAAPASNVLQSIAGWAQCWVSAKPSCAQQLPLCSCPPMHV